MRIVPSNFVVHNNFNNNSNIRNSNGLCFCGIDQDQFVGLPKVKIYNPQENCYGTAIIPKDLTKPSKLVLSTSKPIDLDYNPLRFDYLIDKQSGERIKTMILMSNNNSGKLSYHFLSENLDKEYGYVSFIVCDNPVSCDCKFFSLLEDRPKEGLVGKRLIVDYLQNFDDKKIGGVGKLADKLSVKCCIENGLPFNIVSVADRGSHMAHYLRGKRFYLVDKQEDPYRYKYLQENYGKVDINEILEDLAKGIKSNKKKVNPTLGFAEMYMPEHLVQKYLRELKIRPIL